MFGPKALVFVSYSRKDQEKVDALNRRLASHGIRTWVDRKEIVGGDWRQNIKRGLRRSNFFLACLSRNTVERGEVLQFELDSALEIQRERLEGDIYLLPVRLEPCEVPESLQHLQYLDVDNENDWSRLIRALRSKSPDYRLPLAVAAVLVLAFAAYLWLRSDTQSAFLAAREQGKNAPANTTGPVQLGVTAWRMEKSRESDPPSIREIVHPPARSDGGSAASEEITPVRLSQGASFHLGDRFQIGVESSRSGYLYVVNRSFYQDGAAGPAHLIFPTARIRGGDNHVWPGKLLRLPDRDADPPYWQFESARSDYAGEIVIFLLAPQPDAALASTPESAEIPDATIAQWTSRLGQEVSLKQYVAPQLRLTVEEADARDKGSQLGRSALPPEFIFERQGPPEGSILAVLKIPVGRKP